MKAFLFHHEEMVNYLGELPTVLYGNIGMFYERKAFDVEEAMNKLPKNEENKVFYIDIVMMIVDNNMTERVYKFNDEEIFNLISKKK